MRTPLSVRIADVFVIITTIVGFGLVGAIAITGVRTASSISIGSVNAQSNSSISVPISLRNPGPLSVNGVDISIDIVSANGTGLFTGGGGPISVAPGFSGELPVNVPFNLNQLPSNTLESLATTNQNLTLQAVLNASISSITSVSAKINTSYNWGAPVSNLQLGQISTSPYNATSAEFAVPLSFADASSSLSVDGTVSGAITGQSGNALGTVSPLNLDVSPSDSFSNQLTGFVNSEILTRSTVTLALTFQTSFGTFSEDFVVNA